MGLTFHIRQVDRVLSGLKLGWLTLLTGNYAPHLAEVLCVRAQLPPDQGGLDSHVIFVDGGNTFDLYLISSIARSYRLDVKRVLRRIIISRAFTKYQLATLILEELPRIIDNYGAKMALISDIFYLLSEEPDPTEDEKILDEAVLTLRNLCSKNLLIVCTDTTGADYRIDADVHLRCVKNGSKATISVLRHPTATGNITIDAEVKMAPPLYRRVNYG